MPQFSQFLLYSDEDRIFRLVCRLDYMNLYCLIITSGSYISLLMHLTSNFRHKTLQCTRCNFSNSHRKMYTNVSGESDKTAQVLTRHWWSSSVPGLDYDMVDRLNFAVKCVIQTCRNEAHVWVDREQRLTSLDGYLLQWVSNRSVVAVVGVCCYHC